MIYKQGIDIGDTKVLVYVKELQGKRYIMDRTGPRGLMTLAKQWSQSLTPHPLRTLVRQ